MYVDICLLIMHLPPPPITLDNQQLTAFYGNATQVRQILKLIIKDTITIMYLQESVILYTNLYSLLI
jgi:hypothetical protein